LKKLVFISLEHWDDIWRRNQFFADRMQTDFDVDYVGPVLPITQLFKSKQKKYQNIKCHYIYKIIPKKLGKLAYWINLVFYSIQILIKIGLKTDILWINNHECHFFSNILKSCRCIYDITDDWTLINYPEKLRKAVSKADYMMSKDSDEIIVCSENLYTKKSIKFKEKLHLIKNGINIEDYQVSNELNVTGGYFLYTGSLHQERLDVDLMINIAAVYPDETFMYVGPIFFDEETRRKLQLHQNIILTGAKPYKNMPKLMAMSKALIVPHLQTKFVNSLDPIKQYEYMMSDKAVIVTNVSGFNEWGSIYTVVKTSDAFIDAIKVVIQNQIKVDVVLRKKMAEKNTWDIRYKEVKSVLKSV